MDDRELYSIRMRAALGGPHEDGGKHISGGEHLSAKASMQIKVLELIDKAFTHKRGEPTFFQLTIDKVEEDGQMIKPLPVSTFDSSDAAQGRRIAYSLLADHGISEEIIKKAMNLFESINNTTGALIINAKTGERLDEKKEQGVRVSRLEWKKENFEEWCKQKEMPVNQRMKEALTLATKVCAHPLTIAELCWSDDPDYITGYVASGAKGYQRITKLKEYGDETGGRLFFIKDDQPIESYIHYLQKIPVLIETEENYELN
ncbi:6-carboxyhexanoate--CoA ligase [Halobacillus sp. A5]|uniref:6-carboxyhexanoate--CoA ligase n=1 Tax=Halobacillus sp. A5 TaxID=2880263 RepID=UPI0020A62855|nr:6-carboxyhexanoate--CoA ligase [Halobacillus sp. A5]MCP3028638.1 6-carboxyhexanoate--CoA ligase [Halobacillus sp. A5]